MGMYVSSSDFFILITLLGGGVFILIGLIFKAITIHNVIILKMNAFEEEVDLIKRNF
jgi:hypothetical protein